MRRNATFAAALGALVLLVAGCGGSKKSSSTTEATEGGTTTIGGVSANDHGMKSVSGTTEVELDDYYFEPTVLKGKPGAKVTLELKNKGSVEHNFTLAAQGIDKDLEAGATAKVAVTIPKSGELSFYCKYHKSMGMAGALESTAGGSGSGGMQTGTTTGGKGGY